MRQGGTEEVIMADGQRDDQWRMRGSVEDDGLLRRCWVQSRIKKNKNLHGKPCSGLELPPMTKGNLLPLNDAKGGFKSLIKLCCSVWGTIPTVSLTRREQLVDTEINVHLAQRRLHAQ